MLIFVINEFVLLTGKKYFMTVKYNQFFLNIILSIIHINKKIIKSI